MKKKVLVTSADVPLSAVNLLRTKYDVTVCSSSRDDIISHVSGVHGIFWLPKEDKVDKELLDKAGPNLKVVATMTAGYDGIDVSELKKRGIHLGHTPKVNSGAVAEIAMGLVLCTARKFLESRQKILNDEWQVNRWQWMMGQDLENSTVGIVGFGHIGQAIAKRIKSFDIARLLYYDVVQKNEATDLGAVKVSFDHILKDSDFIFVSCVLNDATRRMFNEEAFSKMKSNAILINVGRGEVVDQDALVDALESGKIWGAGLDVMYPEPLPLNHKLLTLKNCVITPHIGSAKPKTIEAMAMLTAENIIAGIEGIPLPAGIC